MFGEFGVSDFHPVAQGHDALDEKPAVFQAARRR
jgi:hypothetical protein